MGDASGLASALSIPGDSIGVDTEFVREDTFWPIPGLIQVGNAEKVFLIDPLAEMDFTPLARWMQAPEVTKVMHAGFEDLELFAQHFECLPSPYFDTQLAQACLGGPISMGLDALVQSYGFAPLDKSKSRNDWTRRPLSRDLLDYAAQDVLHLPEIAAHQRAQLIEQDRFEWLIEEQQAAMTRVRKHLAGELDPMDRVKGLHHLDGRGMTLMRALVAWREQVARQNNVARSRVVRDEFLMALCSRPSWPGQLSGLPGARGSSLKRYGDAMRAAYEEAMGLPAEDPLPAPRKPTGAERAAQKALKADLVALAERNDLAVEFLAKRRDIERWAAGKGGPSGWRATLLEPIL